MNYILKNISIYNIVMNNILSTYGYGIVKENNEQIIEELKKELTVSPKNFDSNKKKYFMLFTENSKRIYKSATPKYTLDWYIKWIASGFILTAMSIRGIDGFLLFDLVISTIGVALWTVVAVLWKDRALILLNGVGLIFLLRNLFQQL